MVLQTAFKTSLKKSKPLWVAHKLNPKSVWKTASPHAGYPAQSGPEAPIFLNVVNSHSPEIHGIHHKNREQ
jgi:hypothetical protein